MAGVKVTVFPEAAIAAAFRASTPGRVEVATEIVGTAIDTARVESGEFRGGFQVQVSGDQVFAVDNDPEAFYKEYGTADTPAQATLTEAARPHGKYTGLTPGRR